MTINAFSDQALGETDVFKGFPPSGSTLCPRCDYELSNLPPEHQCPECGLSYDGNTRVWFASPARWPTVVMMVIAGIPLTVFGLLFLLGGGSTRILSMASTSLMFVICLLRFRRMKNQILAITPAGIVFRSMNQARRQFAPWEEIRPINLYKLQFSMFLFGAHVIARGFTPIDIKPFAKDRTEIIKLYELIEMQRQLHTKQSDDA